MDPLEPRASRPAGEVLASDDVAGLSFSEVLVVTE